MPACARHPEPTGFCGACTVPGEDAERAHALRTVLRDPALRDQLRDLLRDA